MGNATPCWILSYPRTGSSYLASSLNFTAKYNPIVAEWLNPTVEQRTHQTVKWKPWRDIPLEAVKNSVEPFLENLPPHLKIHCFDYDLFFKKKHLPEIIKRIPNLKIIRLRRKDAIATTASYYLAEQTKVYAVASDEDVQKHAQIQVPINNEILLKYYEWITCWDKECGELLDEVPYEEVFYEDLFYTGSVNEIEIYRIHSLLNIPLSATDRVFSRILDKKMQHPQTQIIQDTLNKLVRSFTI